MPAYQPTDCGQARRRRTRIAAWLLGASLTAPATTTLAQTAAPTAAAQLPGVQSPAAQSPAAQSPAAQSPAAQSPGAPAQRIVLSSSSFKIPFHIAATGDRPVEVQLLIASAEPGTPGGPAWRVMQSQRPGHGHFQLTGVADGRYDFATRTIDASGSAEPAGPPVAELRVVVDTTRPVVRLEPQTDHQGHVRVNLDVDDITAIQTVDAHYITDTTRHWYATEAASDADRPSLRIAPTDDWRQLSVRVRVVDEAGNETLATQMIDRPRIASAPGRLASGQNYLPGSSFSTPWNPPPASHDSPGRVLTGSPSPVDPFAPAATPVASEMRLPPPASADQISQLPPPMGFDPPAAEAAEAAPPAPPQPQTAAEAMRPLPPGPTATPPVLANHAAPEPYQSVLDTPPLPPVTSAKPAKPDLLPTPETPFAEIDSIAAARPQPMPYDDRVVVQPSNSNRFSLEYEVEAVGRDGLATVELYGTTDAGQTWRLWGEDPDRQSPFDIETAGEGDFGFRIVVVGVGGLASPRPQPGDAPDIAVRVDQTAPDVELLGAKFGVGDRIGSLVIHYRGDDANLRPRAMTLSFGPTAQGPWTTIAAGLAAEGQHVWAADPNLPRLLHLRVDGVDAAGNTASDITEEPIDTRGFAPRARIRAFRPLD